MVDLDRGAHRRPAGHQIGARMIALAERLRFLRGFQPTMSSARARHAAEQADRDRRTTTRCRRTPVWVLGREELRAAALAALRAPEQR